MSEIRNTDAEKTILGIAMEYPAKIEEIIFKIKTDDFENQRNRIIFETIQKLHTKRIEPNAAVVADYLQAENRLEIAGGRAYLSELLDSGVSMANLEYYTTKVREARNRRLFEGLGRDLISMSTRQDVTIDEMRVATENQLMKTLDLGTDGYRHIRDFLPDYIADKEARFKNKGAINGIPTGIAVLDDLTTGFQPGQLVLIGARPSVGKTTMLLQIMIESALKNRNSVGMFSMEMPAIQLMNKMTANIEGVPGNLINSGMYREATFAAFHDYAAKIYESEIYINEQSGLYIQEIESEAKRMKRKNDVKAIFIDYFGLIRHPNENIERWRQMSDISIRLKNLARTINVPVIVASQLNRDDDGKMPTLKSLSETKQLEQDADIIIFLHRDGQPQQADDELKAILAKQRNGPIGIFDILHKKSFAKMVQMYKENGE